MDFGALALKKPVAAVTDADIDKALDRLRAANLRYKAKDGAAADGDRLIIDFTGSIDGTPFEGGATEDAPVVLGSGNFIPGFEEGLKARAPERSAKSMRPSPTNIRKQISPASPRTSP